MASPAPAKFRIDVDIHNLLANTGSTGPTPGRIKGAKLPDAVFPQYPELLSDPRPETILIVEIGPASRYGARCAAGCCLTFARAVCRASSITSRLTFFSTTNATSTAGRPSVTQGYIVARHFPLIRYSE